MIERPGGVRLATTLLACLVASACAPASSLAAQSVELDAALTPKRPGQRTTAEFALRIAAPDDGVPPPLVEASVRYPSGLGLALSGLGIETCPRETLETDGVGACPADSFMGEGSAIAEIQFGPTVVHETARVSLVRTPEEGSGQLAMLFLVDGSGPVAAEPVLTGLLLPAAAPFGGRIDIAVPLVKSLPEAPDVSVVGLRLSIGPRGLTYYERVGREVVAYRPKGLVLPERCPRGGYPFAIELHFLDGSRGSAAAAVPCPRPRRR